MTQLLTITLLLFAALAWGTAALVYRRLVRLLAA